MLAVVFVFNQASVIKTSTNYNTNFLILTGLQPEQETPVDEETPAEEEAADEEDTVQEDSEETEEAKEDEEVEESYQFDRLSIVFGFIFYNKNNVLYFRYYISFWYTNFVRI